MFSLTAYWALDEAEGSVAYDSASVNDAAVIGNPAWQPTGGPVEGTLRLDGVDDCVVTGPIQNPAESPFSALLWIKSGVPGRVVLSTIDGANWLCTDTVKGCLMTELKAMGRGAGPLPPSQAVITDGAWHRIGLVWDGSYRRL